MGKIIEKTVEEIKNLKIQGATNIARSVLLALAEDLRTHGYREREELRKKAEKLALARPTESLAQNCLDYVLWQVEKGQPPLLVTDLILAKINDIQREIIKNSLSLLKNKKAILTHCHSSTVEEILKKAYREGNRFSVYLTETRPRFQGRITANHLLKEGLGVTMVTDSEAVFLVSREDQKEIDLVLLGCDALSLEGKAANKVGSYGIALSAQKAKVPFYLATTLLKVTTQKLILEERKPEEIWEKPPKNLKIFNPAFDLIPPELIVGIICEFGIVKPGEIKRLVRQNYPWIIKKVKSPVFPTGGQKSKIKTYKKSTPYKSYLHLGEKVDPKKYILATFHLETGKDFLEISGGVAAESSVGTWTQVTTQLKKIWEKLHARVLEAQKNSSFLKIAYPLDLFEPGNLPQLLSSVAGNIFGLKDVKKLKLLDLEMPEVYIKSFPGPQIGAEGIRKISGIYGRPLIGCIVKPKEGLDFRQHAEVVKEVFAGGVDFVKDDENLTSQVFNPFEKRVAAIMAYLNDVNYSKKIYAFNITAPAQIMEKRAAWVLDYRGNCLMIDILAVGFSACQFIRHKNYGLVIHGHRAGHAALTRDPGWGISMLALAKFSRLGGVDSLHTGTVVGKMEGEAKEVLGINQFLLSEWYGLKTVLPVASGGLHPGLIPDLVKIFGNDCLFNFGGGIHGHPQGSKAGARAVLQALEAVKKGIALKDYAGNHQELAEALKHWP